MNGYFTINITWFIIILKLIYNLKKSPWPLQLWICGDASSLNYFEEYYGFHFCMEKYYSEEEKRRKRRCLLLGDKFVLESRRLGFGDPPWSSYFLHISISHYFFYLLNVHTKDSCVGQLYLVMNLLSSINILCSNLKLKELSTG